MADETKAPVAYATFGDALPDRDELQTLVNTKAQEIGVDPAFVNRLIQQESGWNPAVGHSKAGAVGLMQLMPKTAADYGVTNLQDPHENIKAGMAHLARLKTLYNGDERKMAAAYNAGEGAVAAHGGNVPDFPETKNYVDKVAPYAAFGPEVKTEEVKPPSPGDQKKQDRVAEYQKNNPTLWSRITGAVSDVVNTPGTMANTMVEMGKGAVHGAVNTIDTLTNAARAHVPGFEALSQKLDVAVPPVQVSTTNTNIPQKVGNFIEQGAEFALPAGKVAEGVNLGTKGVSLGTKILAHAVTQAPVGAAVTAAQGGSPTVGAAVGAATGPLGPLAEAAGPMLENVAVSALNSGVRASKSLLKQAPKAWGRTLPEKMSGLSRYILENDLNPTSAKAAVETMKSALEDAKTSPGGMTVVPDIVDQVNQALADLRVKFPNAANSADVEAIVSKLSHEVPGPMVPGPMPKVPSTQGTLFNPAGQRIPATPPMIPGKPIIVPRTDVTAGEIQTLAQDMRASTNPGFNGVANKSTMEADKAVAEAMRRAAGNTSTEIRGATSRMPQAITADRALEDMSSRIQRANTFTKLDAAALAGFMGFATVHPVGAFGAAVDLMVVWARKNPVKASKMIYSLSQAMKNNNGGLARKIGSAILQESGSEVSK